MTETIWRKSFRNTMEKKNYKKKCEQYRTYKYLGHCLVDLKVESKVYRPNILSYNAKTIPLTKFSAERSLADTEEGDENENGSFLHSTAQKYRQAQVNVVR